MGGDTYTHTHTYIHTYTHVNEFLLCRYILLSIKHLRIVTMESSWPAGHKSLVDPVTPMRQQLISLKINKYKFTFTFTMRPTNTHTLAHMQSDWCAARAFSKRNSGTLNLFSAALNCQ